jgi:hypothetical protein
MRTIIGITVTASVASVVALAGVASTGCDAPDPDACEGIPGCTSDGCGQDCIGPIYECNGGEWEVVGVCEDPCRLDPVFGPFLPDDPPRWTLQQTFATTCPGVEPRTEVVITMGANGFEDFTFTSTDPDLVLSPTNVVDYGCTGVVMLAFTDVWLVDGEPTAVSGELEVELANGYMNTTRGITGTVSATAGECELTGTIAGTFYQ